MSTLELEIVTSPSAAPAAESLFLPSVADRTRLDGSVLAATDMLLLGALANATGTAAALTLPLMALYALAELYPGFGMVSHERLRRRWILGALYATILVPFSLSATASIATALLLMPLAESFSRSVLHRLGLWGKGAQVIGPTTALEQNWYLGLVPGQSHDVLVLGPGAQMQHGHSGYREIYLLGEAGIISRIKPPQTAFARWLGQSVVHNPNAAPYRQIKRTVDITASLLLLLTFGIPLITLSMLAIYAVDPGPVIYSHMRRTQHGKPVRVYKLRSMYQDSDERLKKILGSNAAAASWARCFKLQPDPRVLPFIGGLIRMFSIDELPQLFNILKGEMSLVGPRIFVDYDLEIYPPRLLQLRQSVLAGLTGLWQVSVRSDGDNADKVRYDAAYVRCWSLWQDVDILYRTVGAVLTGRGAV